MTLAHVFVGSLQQLVYELVIYLPKLIVALAIWIVGKYLIRLLVGVVKRVKIKGATPVNRLVELLALILLPLGKVLLFFIILDYLGIGSGVISAIVSGFTFAIAIALGLAFGRALEDDAKEVVALVKRNLEK